MQMPLIRHVRRGPALGRRMGYSMFYCEMRDSTNGIAASIMSACQQVSSHQHHASRIVLIEMVRLWVLCFGWNISNISDSSSKSINHVIIIYDEQDVLWQLLTRCTSVAGLLAC
jgi:hypothetical protein